MSTIPIEEQVRMFGTTIDQMRVAKPTQIPPLLWALNLLSLAQEELITDSRKANQNINQAKWFLDNSVNPSQGHPGRIIPFRIQEQGGSIVLDSNCLSIYFDGFGGDSPIRFKVIEGELILELWPEIDEEGEIIVVSLENARSDQ